MDYAVEAADLYIKAYNNNERQSAERQRLERKLMEILTLGEYLKLLVNGPQIPPKQAREITPRETVALVQSSKLHENNFLPWRDSDCSPDAFRLKSNQKPYRCVPESLTTVCYYSHAPRGVSSNTKTSDRTPFPLSKEQLDVFTEWKRPVEVFQSSTASSNSLNQPSLELSTGSDLVQDVTADCSVVASLCSAMRLFCRAEGSVSRGRLSLRDL